MPSRADLQQSAWFLWLSRHRYLIAWKGWEWKRCYALTPVDNGYSNQRWTLKTDSIRFQSLLMPWVRSCSGYTISLSPNFLTYQMKMMGISHPCVEGQMEKWRESIWTGDAVNHSLFPSLIFLIVFLSTILFNWVTLFVISWLSISLQRISENHFQKGQYNNREHVSLHSSKGWSWEVEQIPLPGAPSGINDTYLL